jgi:hypothetical protein
MRVVAITDHGKLAAPQLRHSQRSRAVIGPLRADELHGHLHIPLAAAVADHAQSPTTPLGNTRKLPTPGRLLSVQPNMQLRVCSVVIHEYCEHAAKRPLPLRLAQPVMSANACSARSSPAGRAAASLRARPRSQGQASVGPGHHRSARQSGHGVLVDLDLAPRSQSVTVDRPRRSVRIAPASENLQRTPYLRRRCRTGVPRPPGGVRALVDRQPDVLDAAGTGLGFGKV